jgi:hypothetical protein
VHIAPPEKPKVPASNSQLGSGGRHFSFFLLPSCPGGFPPQHEKPRLKMKQEKGKMKNSNSD